MVSSKENQIFFHLPETSSHITCDSTSLLADYPWNENMTTIIEHDENSRQCLRDHSEAFTEYQRNIRVLNRNSLFKRKFLRRCSTTAENTLYCEADYESFLPYMKVHTDVIKIKVIGMFTTFAVSSNYSNLEHLIIRSYGHMEQFPFQDHSDISRMEDCERLKNLTNLKQLEVNSNKLDTIHFECLPQNLKILNFGWNEISYISDESCQALKNLSSLHTFSLKSNRLESFPIECLPRQVEALDLSWNRFTLLSNESCQALKHLSSLHRINLNDNHLQAFDFNCLPNNVNTLDLLNNDLTTIDFNTLSKLPSLERVILYDNPINCTCSFFVDFVNMLDSTGAKVVSVFEHSKHMSKSDIIKCSEESQLFRFRYPWFANIRALNAHNSRSARCYPTRTQDS